MTVIKLGPFDGAVSAAPETDVLAAFDATNSRQVYIVDDDATVRRSLAFSLRTAGYDTRAFVSGEDFLDEAGTLSPGCILLDVRMPGIEGPEVLRRLSDMLGRFVVITMTAHGDVDTAVRAMKLGSLDFIEKPFADAALMEALEVAFSSLANQLQAQSERTHAVSRIASLTQREREVLQNLVAGRSNKEIANRLNLSARTVEMHRGNLMDGLGAKSVAQVVRMAISAGVKPV